jgi:hypothetical protein
MFLGPRAPIPPKRRAMLEPSLITVLEATQVEYTQNKTLENADRLIDLLTVQGQQLLKAYTALEDKGWHNKPIN